MSETTIDAAAEVADPGAGRELVPGAGAEAPAAEPGEVSALDVQMLRRLADQARDQGPGSGKPNCSSPDPRPP